MIDTNWVVFLNTQGVFIVAGGILVYLALIEKSWVEAIYLVVSVFAAGALVVLLKELFMVPRPFVVDHQVPAAGYRFSSSFPSFHAAMAFSVATSVGVRRKYLGIGLVLIAILVGWGRMLAHVHYFQDVFVGVVIGAMTALFVERTLDL